MITYKVCTDVTMKEIFEAFSLGFSDYVVPLTMDQDAFEARFFGPEGNALNLSFIALDNDKPIGLILGGIRQHDGLKTMRCGTLCIAPAYRGKSISQNLFEMHRSAAASAGCKQLFLEVIKGNDRAIRFYEKYDYRKVYTLKYYFKNISLKPSIRENLPYAVKDISFDALESFRRSLHDCHINWQSDMPSYASSTKEAFLGAYYGNRQAALIAMSPQGKINFLWVDPDYRNQGLGYMMLIEAAQVQKVERITICLPSNASLEGFIRKIGFEKDKVEQYEMYLPL